MQPEILVLLGATAAQALLGSKLHVTQARGKAMSRDEVADLVAGVRTREAWAREARAPRWTFATVHPSSVLRAPDPEARETAREAFFHDLRIVGDYVRAL